MKGKCMHVGERFVRLVSLVLWNILLLKAADEGINAHEFNALCGLYELAKNGVIQPDLEKNYTRVENSVTQIEGLFTATSANESEFTRYQKNNPRIQRAPPSYARDVAHAKLNRTLGRMVELKATMEGARSELSRLYREVNRRLKKGLYGGDGLKPADEHIVNNFFKKVSDQGDATNRYEFCGADGELAGAHESIAMNFACICSDLAGNSDGCGKGFQIAQWNDANEETAKTAYQKAMGKCHLGNLPTTAPRIYEALNAFKNVLGRNAETNQEMYILGKVGGSLSSGRCDGTSATKQCVNYKYYLGDTNKGLKEVPWYKEYLSAARELAQAKQLEGQLNSLFVKAEDLDESANQIFLETMYVSTPTTGGTATQSSATEKNVKQEEQSTPTLVAALSYLPSTALTMLTIVLAL